MSQVLLKTDIDRVTDLIQKWVISHKFTFFDKPPNSCCNYTNCLQITAKNRIFKAKWEYQSLDGETKVTMSMAPRTYLNIILHTAELCGLCYCLFLLDDILNEYPLDKVLLLMVTLIFMFLLIWWRDNRLSIRLDKTEKTFWNMAGNNYDLLQLGIDSDRIVTGRCLLVKEIILSVFVVFLCAKMFGNIGFYIAMILCSVFLTIIIVRHICNSNPHWHWRFWIIDNMSSWFYAMLTPMAVLIGLYVMEMTPLFPSYDKEAVFSPREIIKKGHFREISPATAKVLEPDCQNHFREISKTELLKTTVKFNEVHFEQHVKKRTNVNSIIFLVLTVGAIYFCSYRPLKTLLKQSDTWRNAPERNSANNDVPCIPYLPDAGKWIMPLSFHIMVVILYITGGIVNLIGFIFCFDGLGYILTGHTVFVEKAAHLWSWIFASCKIPFGASNGQIIGSVIIMFLFLPILFLYTFFARRLLLKSILFFSFLTNRMRNSNVAHPKWIMINRYLKTVCSKIDADLPILVLNQNKGVSVHAQWLIFGNKSVIELSRGVLDLLEAEELKAVIMHELGHIRYGVWKVEMLKILSSLAFFPNYYLTLCINWPKYEINADIFALGTTKNPNALKNALIKISALQFGLSQNPQDRGDLFVSKLLKHLYSKYCSVKRSINFFFGDGLLGYTHPCLSERLQAIDANNIQEK